MPRQVPARCPEADSGGRPVPIDPRPPIAQVAGPMVEHILSALASFAIWVISTGGYLGITLLMAIESACIPLPSEIIMPFAGYLVSTGQFNLYLAATAGALGCNLGSVVAYEIGKRGGRPVAERWGKYLLIGRLLPVIRTFIAFPAGVARMKLVPFHLYTFIGSWPFCLVLAIVGRELGEKWDSDPRVKAFFHRADLAIGIVLVVLIGFYIWHRVRGLKRAQD